MKQLLGAIAAIVVIIVVGIFIFDGGEDEYTFLTYENDRYGYQLEYPDDLEAQGEAENGGGQVFFGEDMEVRVLGTQNPENEAFRTIAESYLTNPEAADVTGQAANQIVLSASSGASAEIVKVIGLGSERIAVLQIEYDAERFDARVIDRIVDSFYGTQAGDEDQDEDETDGEDQDGTDERNRTGQVEINYTTYTNESLDFHILRPVEASVDQPTENRIQFTYLGPFNATGEITDGFTVTVYDDPETGAYTSVRAYAQEVIAEDRGGEAEVLSDLQERQVAGYTSYRYSFRTALGNVATKYVFLPDDGNGYTVTYSVIDPNNRGYENIVFTMLESITFTSSDTSDVSRVKRVDVALLDYPASGDMFTRESEGEVRGCDRIVFVTRGVPLTSQPLTAALNELFSIDSMNVEGWQNFIANTNDTLSFDRARVENGTAHIYLTGELTGLAGACDNPRARIQIEETALQFDTVDDVQIYLDDEPTDLQPGGQGA